MIYAKGKNSFHSHLKVHKSQRKDLTIILTGSMIPLYGITPTDAPFNLGFVIAKVFDLQPGVYVSMNERIFSPEEVIKYIKEGKFMSIIMERNK